MEGEEKRARGEGDERGERDRGWWREELKHSKSNYISTAPTSEDIL